MRLTLDEVVSRYQATLFRAAFAVCRCPSDAEDAVQDTLMRYLRNTTDFESEEHIKAWLLRVAMNRAYDLLRSPWRRKRETLEDMCREIPFTAPEDRDVLRAVLSLPRKYRQTVYLYYYEGYSVREIGSLLRARENVVKSWLDRAQRILKDTLREEWNDDES